MLSNFLAKPFVHKLIDLYSKATAFLEKFFLSGLLLIVRLWMAEIFWLSGLTKIASWESTLFLFKDEYKVPFISYEIAAYLSTTVELCCPVFLVLGLASRFTAIPMLAMTAVIQFTYLDLVDHRYWAMLLSLIIFYGPGKLSLDYLIKKYIVKL